jgi:hypothetical protein
MEERYDCKFWGEEGWRGECGGTALLGLLVLLVLLLVSATPCGGVIGEKDGPRGGVL